MTNGGLKSFLKRVEILIVYAISEPHLFVEVFQRSVFSHTTVLNIFHRLLVTGGLGDVVIVIILFCVVRYVHLKPPALWARSGCPSAP